MEMEMEVDRRKRPGEDGDGGGESEVVVKRQREEADMDVGVGDDILAWLSVNDDDDEPPSSTTVADQLVELLDAAEESFPSGAAKVRFIENPYSLPLIIQTTPSSYVTINGNEESCGSSFSDWNSSVMASIDTGSGGCGFGFGFGLKLPGIGFEGLDVDRWGNGGFAAELDGAWDASEGWFGGETKDGYDDIGLDWNDDDDSLAGFLGEIFSEQALA